MTTQLADQLEKILSALPRKTEAEAREWKWNNEVLPHLMASGLPERFWYQAKDWKPAQFETFQDVKKLLKGNGAIVALIGPRGLGKTTICGQIIIERAMNESRPPWHRRPPYRKLAQLIAKYKAIYADFGSKDGESLLRRHKQFCRDHPLVVIDEIHVCEEQKIKNRFLVDTLDNRYANRVDTIIISNESEKEFKENTDPSILSRMKEHGSIIACSWSGWR